MGIAAHPEEKMALAMITPLTLVLALLRGTHPAHAARRARAPAASTPHAHNPARTRTSPGPARGRLEQPCTRAPVPLRLGGACARAGQPRTQGARAALRSGGLHTGRPTTDTSTPLGRKPTNQRHKYAPQGGKDAVCPHGHNTRDADRWGTAEMGRRPGSRVPAFLLPCERGSGDFHYQFHVASGVHRVAHTPILQWFVAEASMPKTVKKRMDDTCHMKYIDHFYQLAIKSILTYFTDVYGHDYMAKKLSVLLVKTRRT